MDIPAVGADSEDSLGHHLPAYSCTASGHLMSATSRIKPLLYKGEFNSVLLYNYLLIIIYRTVLA